MLVENQEVSVKWHNSNKKWYIEKGYSFTKLKETFIVNANDLMPTSKTEVMVKCDYCGKVYKKQYGNYLKEIEKTISKCACKECQGQKISETLKIENGNKYYDEYIALCNHYNYFPVSTKSDFKSWKSSVCFICPLHGEQKVRFDYFKNNGCKKCKLDLSLKKNREKGFDLFLQICSENEYIPISTFKDYKNENSLLKFICPIHGDIKMTLSNMKSGKRCIKCGYIRRGNNNRIKTNDLIDIIESKNENKLLNPEEYTVAINNNLNIICGSCNNIFRTSLNNYRKNETGKCPDCNNSTSMGEYKIAKLLSRYQLDYKKQEHFDGKCRDINPLPFDFYLPYYNLCIEFHGEQHYKPIEFFGGQDAFNVRVRHDEMKKKYCEDNDINYLCIPYWDFDNIEEIIVEKLNLSTFITPRTQRKKMIYKQNKINIQKIA